MVEKSVAEPLPADLPENWNIGQIIAPAGEEVGLSHQHGYNYLMEMVNKAQRGVNRNSETLEGVMEGDLLKLKNVVTVEGGAEMVMDGTFGNTPYEIIVTEEDGTTGVTSFNGRTGAVMPQPGDYTAEDVGAVPAGQFIRSKTVSGTFDGTGRAAIPISGWAAFIGVRVAVQPQNDTTVKAFLGDTEIFSGPVGGNAWHDLFFAFAIKTVSNGGGYVLLGSSAPASYEFYVSLGSAGSYTAEIVRYGPFLPT